MRGNRLGTAFVTGLGIGAGAMFLLDPDGGVRRRHLARDKARHAAREESSAVDKALRDLSHRSEGFVARARIAIGRERPADPIIAERVRAHVGRLVSHPSAIEVRVRDGVVFLGGPILAGELEHLIRAVRRVRGVRRVENRLDVHAKAGKVPGLQGLPRQRTRPALLRESWSPALRLVMAAAGLAAVGAAGALGRTRGPTRVLGAVAGATLFVRAATNLPVKRLVGLGAGFRAIDVQKTIVVHAPVEDVYAFMRRVENFPRFMEHVEDVRVSEDKKHVHMRVRGPGGVSFEWDGEISEEVPNRSFAWRTSPRQRVANAGIVRFETLDGGATRVHIRMSYNPPGGAIGHLLATIFRSDPKSVMDDDLVRMKSLLEEGKTRVHGQRVRIQELEPQVREREVPLGARADLPS